MVQLCKEIVIFLLLAKLLEVFGVGEKYGKFVKLLISLMVVLKLITPVFSAFNGEFGFDKFDFAEEMVNWGEDSENEETDIKEVGLVEIFVQQIEVEDIKWEK